MVGQVRSFNRTVTQRIGALNDEFLSRDRPLGQARLLWEIGPDGCDIRLLRSRLDLDSGYLSRLLRALENNGLVAVEPSQADGRVRIARLTGPGLAERAVLDRRSDDAAVAILEPLSARQRTRLVAAMAEVERLLVASAVQVTECDPRHPDARACLRAYFSELSRRFDGGFDPARSISADDEELTPPEACCWSPPGTASPWGAAPSSSTATGRSRSSGCGSPRPSAGSGSAAGSLPSLRRARQPAGLVPSRLETNRALDEAIGLYRDSGYREVAAFNDEPYAHHWFEKSLGPSSAA